MKHDYKNRPNIDDVWNEFDYKILMGGMGDDTAMLIAELFVRGYEPDEIVFCDTGTELPHTYQFIEDLKTWMGKNDWSKLTVLKKVDLYGEEISVIQDCENRNTLPATAFGGKSCSHKFKIEVANKYLNNNPNCHKAWGIKSKGEPLKNYTGKVLRMVGINYDEPRRAAGWLPNDKYVQVFPLVDWLIGDWESEQVEKVGLYYPGKSSCFICPHMTHGEVAELRDNYPKLFNQALNLEKAYQENELVESDQTDLFGATDYQNSTLGLGGLNGKTWSQMLKEYDDNPTRYKRMTNKKPCECGD